MEGALKSTVVAKPRHVQQLGRLSGRLLLKNLSYTVEGLKLDLASGSLVGFSQHRWLCPTPRVSDSLGLIGGLSVCISTKFPGGDDGLGSAL